MSEQTATQALDIPEDLISRIEQRVRRTEFETTEEYVTYVLEDVLAHVETEADEEFEAAEEAEVQERLRSLGYLNE